MIDHAAVIQDLKAKRDAINAVIGLFRDLYRMPAANNRKDPQPTPLATKRAYKRKTAPSEAPADPNAGRQSPLQDAILKLLKSRGPLTSIATYEELLKAGVQTTAGSVYQTLRLLFEKHLLVKGKDDIGTLIWKIS
jgi:hypothetical protein